MIRDKPLKPFLDLEIYFDEDKTDDENKTLLNNFMNHYKVIYEECFNVKLSDDEIIYINACGKSNDRYKFSYHVIINNNVFFKNMNEQLIFNKYVYELILKKRIKELFIMDNGIYKNDVNLRMINQCKHGEEQRQLINNDVAIIDTFIINYFVTNETQYLNVDGLKDAIYNLNNNGINKTCKNSLPN